MPTTTARIQFIPLAIRSFLQQDYPLKELVIIDDGNGSVGNILPLSQEIKYHHFSSRFPSLGEKRNHACSLSEGEIILHWDDDDWYAPDWISRQASVLEKEEAAICGLNKLWFYRPIDDKCWQYTYNYHKQPWVAGATLAYRKNVWEQRPFEKMNIGEDNLFVWDQKLKVVAHNYEDGFVSILHAKNTSPKHTQDHQWKHIPLATIRNILGPDFKDYQRFHHEPQ